MRIQSIVSGNHQLTSWGCMHFKRAGLLLLLMILAKMEISLKSSISKYQKSIWKSLLLQHRRYKFHKKCNLLFPYRLTIFHRLCSLEAASNPARVPQPSICAGSMSKMCANWKSTAFRNSSLLLYPLSMISG